MRTVLNRAAVPLSCLAVVLLSAWFWDRPDTLINSDTLSPAEFAWDFLHTNRAWAHFQQSRVPSLVPEKETKAAMAMNSVSYNAGRTLAPVFCVAVIANIGAGWAFRGSGRSGVFRRFGG